MITEGFEQDVGLRTTHFTFSTNTLMNSLRSYSRVGFIGPPVSKVSADTGGLSERWRSENHALLPSTRKPDTFSCLTMTAITC